MITRKQEKEIADKFAAEVGVMVTFCQSCQIWIVHCPECGANFCGSGCGCGYLQFLERQQARLESRLDDEFQKST